MADAPAKSFRWLGPGVLTVRPLPGTDGHKVKVFNVGQVVKDAKHLASIGLARVDHFVETGVAEIVTLIDGIFEGKREVIETKAAPEELAQAESIQQLAQDQGEAAKNIAAGQQAAAAEVDKTPGPTGSGAGPK